MPTDLKAALLVEDRDTAYLFIEIDENTPPAGAVVCDIEMADNVLATELENEQTVVWLSNEASTKLKVMAREDVDFGGDFNKLGFYPIPTPLIVEDVAAMERLKEE
jgi:hypothetical protein